MKVNRYDLGEIKSPSVTAQGYLRADSLATRAGVFTYMMKDGSMRRELRPIEEVFKQDSLDTMKLIPVTNNHPPEQLNAENTKKYQYPHGKIFHSFEGYFLMSVGCYYHRLSFFIFINACYGTVETGGVAQTH